MSRDTRKNELAFDKSFVGSMAYQKNNNEDIHKIIANHTNEPTETGIAVYRAVDGIHDLVFVAAEGNSVLNWKSFRLSEQIFFEIRTDYKVNDENVL